jgi:hypothetical protein
MDSRLNPLSLNHAISLSSPRTNTSKACYRFPDISTPPFRSSRCLPELSTDRLQNFRRLHTVLQTIQTIQTVLQIIQIILQTIQTSMPASPPALHASTSHLHTPIASNLTHTYHLHKHNQAGRKEKPGGTAMTAMTHMPHRPDAVQDTVQNVDEAHARQELGEWQAAVGDELVMGGIEDLQTSIANGHAMFVAEYNLKVYLDHPPHAFC